MTDWPPYSMVISFCWVMYTNCMKQISSCEGDGCSSSQIFLRLLWNCFHKSLPLDPIVNHLNPVHTLRPYFFKIHFLYYPPIQV
jgi:hypothetical protein